MTNLKLAGSRFTKIDAERNDDFSGKLEMTTNIKITSIEKIKETKDSIKLKYVFAVDYKELGKITVGGILFLSGDSKTIKEILKSHKDKKYETPEYISITNVIIQKASIKAFEIEEELSLPIHIKLPALSMKKDN
ncbi:hypothetical protein HN935_01200 [archaeon]|jgi:hypothetical protein|nr:hypothetical protein [archaeon]